jgi:hypothetical protein
MSMVSLSNLGFGGSGGNTSLPKAIAELQGLTISLLTGAGAAAPISLPDIEGEDTILAAIAFGGAGSPDGVGMEDITADASIGARQASGTLTVSPLIADGDVIVVNGKTYTFTEMAETTSTNVRPNVIPFEQDASGNADDEVVAARLAQVIMSSDAALTCTVAGAVVTVKWRVSGTVGNSKTLVVSASNGHVTRSGATFTGGAAAGTVSFSGSTIGLAILLFWYNKAP